MEIQNLSSLYTFITQTFLQHFWFLSFLTFLFCHRKDEIVYDNQKSTLFNTRFFSQCEWISPMTHFHVFCVWFFSFAARLLPHSSHIYLFETITIFTILQHPLDLRRTIHLLCCDTFSGDDSAIHKCSVICYLLGQSASSNSEQCAACDGGVHNFLVTERSVSNFAADVRSE